MLSLALLCTALSLPAVQAGFHHHQHRHHDPVARALPAESWYHHESHPVHDLFKRGPTDGVKYPAVGTPEWLSQYPPYGAPDVTKLPKAWTDALAAAEAAGKIPNVPTTRATEGENPVYPNGLIGTNETICSGTALCRIPGDIWDAPDGIIGIGFDDGPQPASDALLNFLVANKQIATHFFIGQNILGYPNEFLKAFNAGDDIAIHTWSHPYMTNQTNLQVLAEIGWTAQVIHDSTGGRVPKFWRPPYGDSDKRTHAIAKEVFGLTGIIWNQDTRDWSITTNGTTPEIVAGQFKGWLAGPKSPGLMILEHERSTESVAAFIAAYPTFKEQGWKPVSQARMGGAVPYQNSANADSTVKVDDILAGGGGVPAAAPSSAIPSAPSSSAKLSTSARSLARETLLPSGSRTAISPLSTGDASTHLPAVLETLLAAFFTAWLLI